MHHGQTVGCLCGCPTRGVVSENWLTAAEISCRNAVMSSVGEMLDENPMILLATPSPSHEMMAWKNSASEAWQEGQ